MEFEAEYVTLCPEAPPCARKRAAFPSFRTTHREGHGVHDDLHNGLGRTRQCFESSQKPLSSGERLRVRGKTAPVFPEHRPPDRRVRMFEDEPGEQQRDETSVSQLSETAGYEPCTLVQVFQSTRLRGGC